MVKLANSNDIQAAVVLHPGPLTDEDINGKFQISDPTKSFCC